MSHKTHTQMELVLTKGDTKGYVTEPSISSKFTDSILGSMQSFISQSHSHSIDFSYHSEDSDGGQGPSIGTNPKNWHFDQVQLWLKTKNLAAFIPIFQKDHRGQGVDGHKLLELNRDILMNEHPFDLAMNDLYYCTEDTTTAEEDTKKYTDNEKKDLISHLLMELAKLQTKNEDFVQDKPLDYTEFNEIRRRMNLFLQKWERILWIEHYEDAFNTLPSKKQIADEFGVTPVISTLYLEAYENIDKQKHQDLSQLFEGFNIIHDCVIWWKLMINELKNKPRKAIWIIFEEIALYTPTPVGISLLEHFRFDLTRFPEDSVDSVCKNLVIASSYPINASLEIARWMKERAQYDISRAELFEEISNNYINTALDYLSMIESDHLATIILEVKSNIKNLSAFDMALEYKLLTFVKDNRIERISNSMMNQYKFLDPSKKNNAFKINPLNTQLFWDKLWTKEFYFTPIGLFVTQLLLYVIYLFLFTFLSSQQFRVYDDMSITEAVFWVFNIGYVLYEVFSIIDEGFHVYLQQASNYFDFVISCLFIASFALRLYVYLMKTYLGGLACLEKNTCQDAKANTAFVILWGINTIALWSRLTFFCILSAELGPMIRMVQRMMHDIGTFLEIILIILIGFIVCLVYVLGDVDDLKDSFGSFHKAFLTLFRASQGDFDWDQFADTTDVNPAFLLFAYVIISIYMIIAAIVLLNLLIAMMAKTFDSINEETISQIIFARFELAVELNRESAFMPPPFNVFAMVGIVLFYIIELVLNWSVCLCASVPCDLAVFIMPSWMKWKKLELDEQILGQKIHIITSEGDSVGLITDFDRDIHHHEITFYEDDEISKKNVIIGDHVLKQNKWNVDIFKLSQLKYLRLHQFRQKISSKMTHDFKQNMKKVRRKHLKSHSWICSFCKMYVVESKMSIKRLGWELNVNDRDLNILARIAPEICPNCYRVRHETQRWRFIWEIISLYIYYIAVFPILFVLLSLALLWNMIRNPSQGVHLWQVLKKHIHHCCHHISCCKPRNLLTRYDSNTRAALKAMHAADVHHEDSDSSEESSSSDSEIDYDAMSYKQIARLKAKKKIRKKDYVAGHYDSHELIHSLHHMGTGDTDELFDHSLSSSIWTNLYSAKRSIDLCIMLERVSEHIISLSSEDEITELDFYIDFINYEDLKKDDFTKWEMLFGPFAAAIFNHIHDSREMELPLHLFAKYPMAPRIVLDDFEHWHHATNSHDMKINECSATHIVDFLEEYGSLRCKNRDELESLLAHITESDDYKHDHHTEYDQFVAYLKEVRSLFTETKKLKNLIRDVGVAIIERGADHEIIREEIDLLFEEIPTSIVALPFFRAMKQETDIIKLWTIRNFLQIVYLLRALVKDKMVEMNPHIYVTKRQLIRQIYEQFGHKIVDKRGIMEQFVRKKRKKIQVIKRHKTKLMFADSDEEEESSTEESDEEEEEWKGHDRSLNCENTSSDDGDNEAEEEEKQQVQKHHSSDESDHDHEKRELKRLEKKKQLHRNQQRIKLLHTAHLTASTVAKTVGFIFDQIRFGRKKKVKITSSTMEHYQHKLALAFRNNDALKFVYSQLCRYIIFSPSSLSDECTADKLNEILSTLSYDDHHVIDIESRPNYGDYDNIYRQIELIWQHTKKKNAKYMSIEDAVCIVLLYYRIFSNLEEKVNARADDFVVTRPVFLKFCDRDNFHPGMDVEKWSKTAKEASNLFQSVLDTEQDYVTLGELRQTIIHLMNDADDMMAGRLVRIRNYLVQRVDKDEVRRQKMYPKYLQKMAKWQQIEDKKQNNKSKKPSNPKLQYSMINVQKFAEFIEKISDGYVPRVDGHKIETRTDSSGDVVMFSRIASVAICVKKDEVIDEEKEHNEAGAATARKQYTAGKTVDIKKMNRKYKIVYDTMLKKYEHRITLQQLMMYLRSFRRWLQSNEYLLQLMNDYDAAEEDDELLFKMEEKMKKKKMKNYGHFFAKYFGNECYTKKGFTREAYLQHIKKRDREIRWIYNQCHAEFDFIYLLQPFMHGKIIREIEELLHSSDQVEGNYELRSEEFAQLKHQLHVNGHAAVHLFHIMRAHQQSLSWKQILSYFVFLNKMKAVLDDSIRRNPKGEDADLSIQKMKLELHVTSQDEANWLFETVEHHHAQKVSWKHVRKYLKKSLMVRQDVKDFFVEQEAQKEYQQNAYVLVNKLQRGIDQLNKTK
eukprot:277150_1